MSGIYTHGLITILCECCPTTKLVALSVKPEHEQAAKEYGVDGFISKQMPADFFLQALNVILWGEEK